MECNFEPGIEHLGQLAFLHSKGNVILLGPRTATE
jgi:hypothetical protein